MDLRGKHTDCSTHLTLKSATLANERPKFRTAVNTDHTQTCQSALHDTNQMGLRENCHYNQRI